MAKLAPPGCLLLKPLVFHQLLPVTGLPNNVSSSKVFSGIVVGETLSYGMGTMPTTLELLGHLRNGDPRPGHSAA